MVTRAQRHFHGQELKGGLVSVGSEQSFSSVEEFGSSGSQMDSRELQEICQDLRSHC